METTATTPRQSAAVDTRQVKVAYCQHCGGWILVACFPDCEKRVESRREFVKCINAGNTINVVLLTEHNKAHKNMCMGHKKQKATQPSLF